MIGQLIIIAAPSGTGKTSLVQALLKEMTDLVVSVSYTTRAKRAKEQDEIDYHFISMATFEVMVRQEAFLEYARVYDHYYGTGRDWVTNQLRQGQDVILEIDWQGAAQIRRAYGDTSSIFILPPSLKTLEERLHYRGQDSREVIEKRLRQANEEIKHHYEFDYLIVNDNFDQALAELKAVVTAIRLMHPKQMQKCAKLLAELGAN